ncbi:UPF0149 family protein [Allohahella sp. A8]|uniref:UPF0149 family protein n=1 Tax=Allohahella sp. A8 TaxID=3141461 RepID=UPI000C0A2ECE|nr:hypothetical protein [Hahellaceae bacterium]|tara:strand:+ start:16885 stop:17580 length:696 start_codon:yes stop_codon:yes gene_type:complete
MATPQKALAQILQQLNSPVSAAYIHGLWSGRVVAGDSASIAASELDPSERESFSSLDPGRLAETPWWLHTDAVLDSDETVDAPYIKALALIFGYAEEALASDAMDFSLWLDNSTDDIAVKLDELAEWSQGFLEGFSALLGDQIMDISDDAQELIEDLIAIGELDPDSAAEEVEEGAEFDFLQIEEFVKTAVLHFWHDFRITKTSKTTGTETKQGVSVDDSDSDSLDGVTVH